MRPKHARGNSQKNGSYSQGALRHLVFRSSEHNQNCVAYSRRSSGGPVAAQRARQGSARHSREGVAVSGRGPSMGPARGSRGHVGKARAKTPAKESAQVPKHPTTILPHCMGPIGCGGYPPPCLHKCPKPFKYDALWATGNFLWSSKTMRVRCSACNDARCTSSAEARVAKHPATNWPRQELVLFQTYGGPKRVASILLIFRLRAPRVLGGSTPQARQGFCFDEDVWHKLNVDDGTEKRIASATLYEHSPNTYFQ